MFLRRRRLAGAEKKNAETINLAAIIVVPAEGGRGGVGSPVEKAQRRRREENTEDRKGRGKYSLF